MTEAKPEARTITVAHSPDSDDAFMFYGLATNKLETDGLKFEHTLKDIQTLNEDAKNGVFDVTAISFHAYAYISDKYALLAARREHRRQIRSDSSSRKSSTNPKIFQN